MTPAQLRAAQNRINAPVALLTLGLVRRLPRRPGPASWTALGRLVFPAVNRARGRSLDLAQDFYSSVSPTGNVPDDVPAIEYTALMLMAALNRYGVEPIQELERAASSANETPSRTREEIAAEAAASVVRHVEQAAREWTALAANRDGARYARIDPDGETCAFCRLLISRGPVYLSQTSGAFRSHPHCTCIAVPVFDPTEDWPGKEQFEQAEALYAEATVGRSGKDAIRAYRRAVESPRT